MKWFIHHVHRTSVILDNDIFMACHANSYVEAYKK